jgi:hypothetical protein
MIGSPLSIVRKLADRLLIRLSPSIRVDGLWIGAFCGDEQQVFEILRSALELIQKHDPSRYKRIIREFDKVWVISLPGHPAYFVPAIRRCMIDDRYLLSSPIEFIASSLVHEATHGRLTRCGFGYSEDIRYRVERLCIRQERAFATRIPNNEPLLDRINRKLMIPADHWTDQNTKVRFRAGFLGMSKDGGLPEWLARVLLSIHDKVVKPR